MDESNSFLNCLPKSSEGYPRAPPHCQKKSIFANHQCSELQPWIVISNLQTTLMVPPPSAEFPRQLTFSIRFFSKYVRYLVFGVFLVMVIIPALPPRYTVPVNSYDPFSRDCVDFP